MVCQLGWVMWPKLAKWFTNLLPKKYASWVQFKRQEENAPTQVAYLRIIVRLHIRGSAVFSPFKRECIIEDFLRPRTCLSCFPIGSGNLKRPCFAAGLSQDPEGIGTGSLAPRVRQSQSRSQTRGSKLSADSGHQIPGGTLRGLAPSSGVGRRPSGRSWRWTSPACGAATWVRRRTLKGAPTAGSQPSHSRTHSPTHPLTAPTPCTLSIKT